MERARSGYAVVAACAAAWIGACHSIAVAAHGVADARAVFVFRVRACNSLELGGAAHVAMDHRGHDACRFARDAASRSSNAEQQNHVQSTGLAYVRIDRASFSSQGVALAACSKARKQHVDWATQCFRHNHLVELANVCRWTCGLQAPARARRASKHSLFHRGEWKISLPGYVSHERLAKLVCAW